MLVREDHSLTSQVLEVVSKTLNLVDEGLSIEQKPHLLSITNPSFLNLYPAQVSYSKSRA